MNMSNCTIGENTQGGGYCLSDLCKCTKTEGKNKQVVLPTFGSVGREYRATQC